MRSLTIKRAKRFVGCMGIMRVYIEDPASTELIIHNVSCRKLGDLKNGEEKTFAIGDAAAKVFVIADMMSKEYCNEFYQLPEGSQDVYLTGKNEFNPAVGNAFRFDHNDNEEALANRKRGRKKGYGVLVASMSVSLAVSLLLSLVIILNALNIFNTAPKTFEASGISITLTESFEKEESVEYAWAHALYFTRDVDVIIEREAIDMANSYKGYTLEQYANLVIQNNDLNCDLEKADGLLYCKSQSTDSNGLVYITYCYFYRSDDAFWRVRFCTTSDQLEKYETLIPQWAKSVKFTD